jgi:hypothetical protein
LDPGSMSADDDDDLVVVVVLVMLLWQSRQSEWGFVFWKLFPMKDNQPTDREGGRFLTKRLCATSYQFLHGIKNGAPLVLVLLSHTSFWHTRPTVPYGTCKTTIPPRRRMPIPIVNLHSVWVWCTGEYEYDVWYRGVVLRTQFVCATSDTDNAHSSRPTTLQLLLSQTCHQVF